MIGKCVFNLCRIGYYKLTIKMLILNSLTAPNDKRSVYVVSIVLSAHTCQMFVIFSVFNIHFKTIC